MPDHEHRTPTTTSTSSSSSTTHGVSDDQQDTVGNSGLIERVQSEATLTGIVHIGLNKYAQDEARVLNDANRGAGGAKSVRQRGHEQDVVTRDGARYDLSLGEGVTGFVGTLQVPQAVAEQIEDLLSDTGGKAKDEMAGVVEVYLQAEQGIRSMDRLVLSGHSVGSQIWGDDNGTIRFDMFERLRDIFPNAANQVKHLMVSACYAGGERNLERFHDMFPSLESIWAYSGSSPGTWSGAIPHLESWETATEDKDGTDVERSLASGTRKAENVATWNIEDGYQGDKPFSISDLERDLAGQESTFERFFNGQEEVTNTQAGPLRDYYNLLQRLVQHPELDGARATQLEARRDLTIRLLYFSLCAGKFGDHYGRQLSEGYAEVGMAVPDFASLSRANALAAIEAFEAAGGGGAALDLLQRGLRDMDNEVIPTNWV